MTARAPRQQRAEERAAALVAAAAAVISRDGPAAFSARAVAAQASLPLASVSYYYPRLDDLLAAALHVVLDGWLARAVAIADRPRRGSGRGAAAASRALAAAFLPDPATTDSVRARYEHLLAAARVPAAAAALARLRPELAAVARRILDRAAVGSSVTPDTLISVIDGAAVGAVSEGIPDPADAVRRQVHELLAATSARRHAAGTGSRITRAIR